MSGSQPSDDDDVDLFAPGDPSRFVAGRDDIEMLGPLKKTSGNMPLDEAGNPNPDVADIDFPEDEDTEGSPPVAGRT